MTGMVLWSLFFKYASDPDFKDALLRVVTAKEEIKVAAEVLTAISKDEHQRSPCTRL